jgi:hypothetical protein
MVTLLSDYPDERRAFKSDVNSAKKEISSVLTTAFPDIEFTFRSFKSFWHPNPTDMSAILQIQFKSGSLCACCSQEFDTCIENTYFKFNNKIQRPEVSFSSKYMDEGLSTYELRFKRAIKDYQ